MSNIAKRILVGVAIAIVMMFVHKMARAYPATSTPSAPAVIKLYPTPSLTGLGYTSHADACSALAPGYTGFTGCVDKVAPFDPLFRTCSCSTNGSVSGAHAARWACGDGSVNTNATAGSTAPTCAATYTCPNGGTLSGTTCTCSGGLVDNGTACVANTCGPLAGATSYPNVTVGWALSPVGGAPDKLPGVTYPRTACQDGCALTAGATPSTDPNTLCWRSLQPTETGLYRISCDYQFVNSGLACTANPNDPNAPNSPPALCPGSVGTFNGKAICLGVSVGNDVSLPKADGAGNPKAGTSPLVDSNAGREPAAPVGAPDARGGPGVSVGANGSIGTGTNRAPGTGTTGTSPGAGGQEHPTDYTREATLQTTNTKLQSIRDKLESGLKIDETGVGDGTGVETQATEGINTESGKISSGIEGIVAGTSAPNSSWGFSINFPSTCTPFNIGTNRWGFYSVDFCQWQPIVHDIMSLIWVAVSIFLSIGMVVRTVAAG